MSIGIPSDTRTATYQLTRDQLIAQAYKKIGKLEDGETLSADQLNDGIFALNLIIREWSASGRHIWKYATYVQTLTANRFVYTSDDGLPAIDEIVTASYRDSSAQDSPLKILTIEQYEALDDKTRTGDPEYLYLDKNILFTGRTLYVTPVPSTVNATSVVVGTDTLNYTCIRAHSADSNNEPITGANWRLYWQQSGDGGSTWVSGSSYTATQAIRLVYKQPVYEFTAASDTPDFPLEWDRALLYALASDLADDNGSSAEKIQTLSAKAKGAYDSIHRRQLPQTTDVHDKTEYF